jgi:hypothetical protein
LAPDATATTVLGKAGADFPKSFRIKVRLTTLKNAHGLGR